LFSSASRAVDASTSKMPPQQPDRLLDLFNQTFDFGAHGLSRLRHQPPVSMLGRDVAADSAKRNHLIATVRMTRRFPDTEWCGQHPGDRQ
jgi:hypothetical protein